MLLLRRHVAGLLFLSVVAARSTAAAPADEQRLLDAVAHGNVAAVRTLLPKAGATARQADGETALHKAALRNDTNIARLLLGAGANVNAANDFGVTPLLAACLNGSVAMTELLLEHGANANAALPTGETPLMDAARSGRVEVVDALVRHGANVQAAEGVRGQTALMWAIAEEHSDVARALVGHGANVRARSKAGFTPLMFASRMGNIEVATLLLKGGADINERSEEGSTALLVASVRGHVPTALFLMDHGADPNAGTAGYTPLHWAAGKWESIVTHDYQVDEGEWSAMSGIPTREAKVTLLKALLQHGADVNAVVTKDPPRYGFTLFPRAFVLGGTPFYLAAMAADIDTMRLLLANGADPEIRSKNGTTALMVAAGRVRTDEESLVSDSQHFEALKFVFGLGTDINVANDEGYSALHSAAYAGNNLVVQYLVDQGARLNDKEKNGQTPLSIAEGVVVSTQIVKRPLTAELLRKLGGTL